jgi:putative radical SAM enzyme (TIGR03279 family)
MKKKSTAEVRCAVKKNEIKRVLKGSIADEIGLEKGDCIIKINGTEIRDILDYRFLMSDEFITLTVETKQGDIAEVEIEKECYEDLGVEFESGLIDGAKRCANRCVFCFIDQLPKGMRETLYFKDDDTRLSFFQGNYVTLTNLSEDEIDRLIKMRVSPINVSVHTTNPELRVKMLGNKNAGDIVEKMRRFAENNIIMNAQIVLCPTFNDGEELERTFSDLLEIGTVKSVSVVPIGKTKYRDGLCAIPSVTKEDATSVIAATEKWQKKALEKTGSRLFYASDEFYLKAEREIPPASEYEEFPQIENGVGLIASMKDEFDRALDEIEKPERLPHVSIATGKAAYNFIKSIAKTAENKYNGLKADVYEIMNNFFGEEITVTGLLCGCDIIEQLSGKDLGERLIISKSMLRDSTDVLLDDVTVREISEKLKVEVFPVENDGYEFLEAILKIGG